MIYTVNFIDYDSFFFFVFFLPHFFLLLPTGKKSVDAGNNTIDKVILDPFSG